VKHVHGVELRGTVEARDMPRDERCDLVDAVLDLADGDRIHDESAEEIEAIIASGLVQVDQTHGTRLSGWKWRLSAGPPSSPPDR